MNTPQTCIVHLIRNNIDYATWEKRRELSKALKPIYQTLMPSKRSPPMKPDLVQAISLQFAISTS